VVNQPADRRRRHPQSRGVGDRSARGLPGLPPAQVPRIAPIPAKQFTSTTIVRMAPPLAIASRRPSRQAANSRLSHSGIRIEEARFPATVRRSTGSAASAGAKRQNPRPIDACTKERSGSDTPGALRCVRIVGLFGNRQHQREAQVRGRATRVPKPINLRVIELAFSAGN